jgi:hypothetical protein
LLSSIGKFTELVRLVFTKPGLPSVDLPGCNDSQQVDPEAPDLGHVRVVFQRATGNLLVGSQLIAEIPILSADNQSVLIRVGCLLAFLRKIDARSELELVKYRRSEKLYLKWTSDDCPGRWDHVQIDQVDDTAESLDNENVQLKAWKIMADCSVAGPHFKVVVSVKELQRVMSSVRLETGTSGDKGFGKKSSGSQSAVEFEFLVPERVGDDELRQVEFHVGGIYAAESHVNFYQRYLLRESPLPPEALENEHLRQGLWLDLTLQDHHIGAQDRRRDNYDVLCRERFSGDLFKDVLDAISGLHPFQDKISLVFYLPDELDWDSDFENVPGERIIKRPMGIIVEADKTAAFFFLMHQIITD